MIPIEIDIDIGSWILVRFLCNTKFEHGSGSWILKIHMHMQQSTEYNWQRFKISFLYWFKSTTVLFMRCEKFWYWISHHYHRHRIRIQFGGMCDVIMSLTLGDDYQIKLSSLSPSLSHQNSSFSWDQDCQTTPNNSCLAKGTHIFNDCAGGHQGGHCVVHGETCHPDKNGEVVDSEDCKSFNFQQCQCCSITRISYNVSL